MTEQEAIERLRTLQSSDDTEAAHAEADRVLCQFLTRVVTDDLICFDDAYSQTRYDDDTAVRDLVAAFYRRHRRACITVARFAGVPVAHGLFLSSLPF